MPYVRPESLDNFVDYPLPKARPRWDGKGETIPCPACLQYGGWNIALNQYPLPEGYQDTAENRHKYVHFRAHCSMCNGWGWTKNTCVHEFDQTENLGRCYNRHHCKKCDIWVYIDSSD